MAGPWYTSDQLMGDVSRILKKKVADIADYWQPLCVEAVESAYRDLSEILLGKSYTIAQLDAWDNRRSYSRQQSLFWLFTETVLGLDMSDKEINKLDHRKQLMESTTIMIGGVPVAPAGEDTGGIGGGLISEEGYRITGATEF
jgi:hypothetical protein